MRFLNALQSVFFTKSNRNPNLRESHLISVYSRCTVVSSNITIISNVKLLFFQQFFVLLMAHLKIVHGTLVCHSTPNSDLCSRCYRPFFGVVWSHFLSISYLGTIWKGGEFLNLKISENLLKNSTFPDFWFFVLNQLK